MTSHIPTNFANVDYIITMLSNIFPVSEKLGEEFRKHAVQISLKAGEHILEEGEICNYMYFVKSGAVIGYTHHNHKKIITYITIENEFVSSLSGLYGEQPSREAIKAIEPTVLLGVHTDILLGWYEEFFDLNYIIRKVYESYYREAQERSHIVRIGNAKDRYLYFLQTKDASIKRLPIPILASFLDIKPQTLLNIRKEIANDVSDKESEHLMITLIDFLLINQSFRNKNLNSKIFADENNICVKKLNRCINRNLKSNFKDFINNYRIAYFNELLLKDKATKNFTVDAMAAEAGFASRSSFYLAYKKQQGQYPRFAH